MDINNGIEAVTYWSGALQDARRGGAPPDKLKALAADLEEATIGLKFAIEDMENEKYRRNRHQNDHADKPRMAPRRANGPA